MANKAPQQLIDDAIAKGAILSTMYFDISANQKDVVQSSLADLIGRLTREMGIISAVGEIDEPIEIEGVWSTSAEVTLLAKDFSSLLVVAIRYGPLGVEVMRPDPIRLSAREAQGTLLNVAQIGQDFSQFVMEKIMDDKQRAQFKKMLAARAEQGKKLIEKAKEKKEE